MGTVKKTILPLLVSGLLWTTTSTSDEQRTISIRNTGSSWAQGVCFLQFELDNGGMGEFGNLSVTVQLTDQSGKALSGGTLDVPPFGDSDATHTTTAILEADCAAAEKARSVNIIQATEVKPGNVASHLPVATFIPQYYQPLKITVGDSH